MFQVWPKPDSEDLHLKYIQYITLFYPVIRFFGEVSSGKFVKDNFHKPPQMVFVSTTQTQKLIHDIESAPSGTSLWKN